MEMTSKIIEQLQDFAKLQDVLFLIEHKMEGHKVDTPLPTFNDEWLEGMVSKLLESKDDKE
nr:MAG TPA: hypothetical protein [Caudoviricetes sp.]